MSATIRSARLGREERTLGGVRVVRKVSTNTDDVVRDRRAWLGKLTVAGVSRSLSLPLICVMSFAVAGCVTIPRASFTADEEAAAAPPGFGEIRYRQDDPALADMLARTLQPDAEGYVNALAISGGGANGAYGAGLLNGWTTSGHRPRFKW